MVSRINATVRKENDMNKNLLSARMVEHNVNNAQLAEALSIDEATLYRKKSGVSDFYRREIQILKKYLDLSDEDIRLIFFADDVV